MKEFLVRRALIIVTAASILFLAALSWAFGEISYSPFNMTYWLGPEPTAEDLRNYFWAIGLPLGSVIVLITLVNSLRRTGVMERQGEIERRRSELERDELNSSTFARATELLSSDQISSRLGGIHSLEALMRADFENPESDHHFGRQVGDTLAAFVRTQSLKLNPHPPDGEAPNLDEEFNVAPVDITTAAVALVRSWPHTFRPSLSREGGIDLRDAWLSGAYFPEQSNFMSINLSHARMRSVALRGAILDGALLHGAILQQCHAHHVSAKNADFRYAKIENCLFPSSDFTDAILVSATFNGTFVDGCRFDGADLSSVRISFTESPGKLGWTEDQLASAKFSNERDREHMIDRLKPRPMKNTILDTFPSKL